MMNLFLLLSLAQADAAPPMDGVQQERPERVHQRPEVAPQDRGELARKSKKLKRAKKARRGRKGPRGAQSFSGQGQKAGVRGPGVRGPGAKGPGAKQGRDPYATCQADIREDRRDQAEDRRDRAEDRLDARHQGGKRDRQEDVRDRREDRRDRAEDRYDSTHGCSRR
jgi:hypothetical protein